MRYKKWVRRLSRYKWAVGLILLGLAGVSVWWLMRPSSPLPVAESALASPIPQRHETDISIHEASMAGKWLGVRDTSLVAVDLNTQAAEVIATGVAFKQPHRLIDGRLAAFYQKEAQAPWRLLLQKDSKFEEIELPELRTTQAPYRQIVPTVDPAGQFVTYVDVRPEHDTDPARPVVVRYSVPSMAEEILTKPSLLSVEKVFVSPDGQWIGFTYFKVTGKTVAESRSFGIIPSTTQSLNLFPQFVLTNDLVRFSADSTHLLFQDKKGVEVFDLNEATVTDTLKKVSLVTSLANGFIGVTEASSPVSSLLKSCKTQAALSVTNLDWYQITGKTFKKVGSTVLKNTVFGAQDLSTQPTDHWLTQRYTATQCDGEWGLWNFDKKAFTASESLKSIVIP